MKTGGWIFIVFSWGIVFGLVIFCYFKILKKK